MRMWMKTAATQEPALTNSRKDITSKTNMLNYRRSSSHQRRHDKCCGITFKPVVWMTLLVDLLVWNSTYCYAAKSVQAECDACVFDGHDKDSCKVYGQSQTTHALIAWNLASRPCLELYGIHTESLNATGVQQIWPDGLTGGSGNAKTFVDFLKQARNFIDNEVVKNSLMDYLSNFFKESFVGGPLLFHSQVFVGESSYVCSQQGDDCWAALRIYLDATTDGQAAFQAISHKWFNVVRYDKEQEQRIVRIQLCKDSATPAEASFNGVCGVLAQQVQDQYQKDGQPDCSWYGQGLGTSSTSNGCLLDAQGAWNQGFQTADKKRSSSSLVNLSWFWGLIFGLVMHLAVL